MNLRRWVVTLGLCILLIGGLAGYKIWQIRSAIAFAESFPEHSETVSPEKATSVIYQPKIEVVGEVVVPERVSLRNELAGRINTVLVKPGDQVGKGQIIFQMDISEELAKQQSAQARLQLAEVDHRRVKDLRKRKAVSQADLDKAIADLQVVRSELAVIESTINKKTLRAPFDGVMGLHQLEQGSYLQPNTDIAEFVGDRLWLWIEFAVPQFYPLLDNGTEVTVSLVGVEKSEVRAEVIARDTVVSVGTRAYNYRARINARPVGFVHNASVQVIAPKGNNISLIKVPLESVQFDEQGAYVYQLQAAEQSGAYRALRQDITVYQRNGDNVLVEQGLKAGETLAGVGAFKLQSGVLVYPLVGDSQQTGI